ncbi:MAG: hypothetical protein J2P21_32705, partial [Chloracidobacterium sp.]|nr:hypothetical protein [Chloracidobacterium sp.]
RTDGGYADLNINYGQPGGGNTSMQYFSVFGTTAINDWAARTKSRYNSLQVALNRPFKNGLMLKGAYTLSHSMDMADEDGWVGLTWNTPLKYADNFATSGFDRTHVFQMGFLYELPFLKGKNNLVGNVLGNWQVSGIYSHYSGTPFAIGGTNTAMNCPGCGSILINYSGNANPIGSVGSSTETYYDPSQFSQPTGTTVAGFGNTGRSTFRSPRVWNTDLSIFKQFKIKERIRPELRIEATNIFNHTNWAAPVTSFTSINFLKFTPSQAESGDVNGAYGPGPRRIQIGLRVSF